MSRMLDATEQTRPILSYVRTLESLVRSLRQELADQKKAPLRFRAVTFLGGVAAGSVLSWIMAAGAWFLARHQ